MADYFLDGGTITLAGTTPTLAVAHGVNGRIASIIAGSAGLRVAMGANANLTLSGNNTYTGATTVNGGTLTIEPTVNVGNNGTLTQSSSSYAVGSGTTLRFDGSAVQGGTQFAVWDINPVNVAQNGTLELFTNATIHNNPDTNALLFNWTNADQFTGGGFIRKLGAGAAAINGTNALTNFTGNFFVSEGTLSLQGATTTANATFRMVVNGSLDIRSDNHTVGGLSGSGAIIKSFSGASTLSVGSNNQNADFHGNITGAGNPTALALRKIGSGTQNLYGMNTYSGATTLEAGVLALNFGDAGVTSNMLSPASPLVLGGGALSLTGGGPATQTFNTASTAANTGSRIFVGADKTLTLSAFTPGANAALNFDVSAGGANGATVGTAIVVLTGTLNANITVSDTGFGRAGLNGSNQVVRLTTDPLLPASGATSANHYRIDNNAGGPAASGSASLALTASQSAGSITVDTTTGAGTLTLGSGVALSSNIFNFGGGGTNPYQITGGTGLTSVASGNTIAFNNYNGGTVTIGSPIVANGTNAMVFNGPGTTALTATNTFTGALLVSGGSVEIAGSGRLGSGSYAAGITIGNGSTFKYKSSAAQTLTGAIDGSGTFAHEGAGTVTLTTAAGGSAATTVGVNGGGVNSLLEMNSGATLANTAAMTIHKDARLLLLGTDPSGNLNGNQIQSAASNASLVINGTLEAAGNQAHTLYATNITMNNGTLTSSGSNPGTNFGGAQFGAFFVSGSRTITLNGATNAISGTRGLGVNTGAVLTLNTPQASDAAAVSVTVGIGTAGNAGGLAKSGAGTVTLSASNAYTGATTVNGGTFEIGGAGRLGGGSYAGDIAIGSGATFKYNSSAAQSLTGIISGVGALVKDGSATLTLTGANTYSGATTISGGALSIAATPHLPSASAVTLSGGGTLRTTANLTLANAVTIASGQTGVIQATGTNTTTLVGNHSGVAGTLTLDLVGVTSNYGGMLIGAGATGPAVGSVINILGATGANNVQVAAYATETIDYFANSKVSVTATGSGNTYLAFGNGFSTHVRFGALDGGNATTLVGFDNKTGTSVTIEGIANGNFAGRIFDGFTPGSLELIKNGTGTQTLSGTNTYTGTTTVNAGTLVVTGSISGTSTTVASTATLSGTGTVGGSTTVNGTLEGGIGAAGGTLTFTSAVSLSGSSVIKLALDGALNHSTLAFNGAEIFDATQDFNFLNLGAVTGTYTSILTGITANPGSLAGWEILNPGFVGTFAYNSGNQAIDLNLIAIPEPNAALSLLGGLGALLGLRHRRRS